MSGGTRGRRHGVTRAPSWLDCREWSDDVWLRTNTTYIIAAERPTPSQAIRHDFATSITAATDHAPASRPPLASCGQAADKSRFSSLGFSLGGTVHKGMGGDLEGTPIRAEQSRRISALFYNSDFFIVTYVFRILKRYRTGNLLQNSQKNIANSLWTRSSRVVRATDGLCQSGNSPGFNPPYNPTQ